MATFVVPVTILVTDLTNPENFTNDLIILNSIDNKQIQSWLWHLATAYSVVAKWCKIKSYPEAKY